jgi:hypothetical protein
VIDFVITALLLTPIAIAARGGPIILSITSFLAGIHLAYTHLPIT